MTQLGTKEKKGQSMDIKGLTRESGKDLIDLEEKSIRQMVRIWNPSNAVEEADRLTRKKCYSTSHKRMVQVIQSEMERMQGGVSA